MKELTKQGFIAWLRQQDGKPCGDGDRCPIAMFLDLPPEDYEEGVEDPNEVAMDLAKNAGLFEFITWADARAKDGGMRWWSVITGDEAADFLESLP
jgi:hypothetical protein